MSRSSPPAFTDKVAPFQEAIDVALEGACTKVDLYEDINGLVGASALCEMSLMDLAERPADNLELAFRDQACSDLSKIATLLDDVKCTRINVLIGVGSTLVSVGHVYHVSGKWDISSANLKLQPFLGTNLALQQFSQNLLNVLRNTTGKEM